MDFDATIERLNALKLQERGPSQPRVEHTTQQQLELRRLQEENERRVLEQERQLQQWQAEMREMQTRLEATEHQNRLLKAALGEVDTYRHQAETQQLVIDELQSQVKQLRITNYRLQYVVQQNEPRGQGSFLPPPPPDIF
ncbi:hypothetical protein PR003_g1101 [Phytophthora rubi]|uniref:Uncharacterized protein n=1 Tax=Phytophthora rubi TaxID=129364 RepID=A0A6A3PCL2_9STRA|nr:hypothetical protein PR002_g1023 [Phytophthora rubi]KAE9052077.1 hypothetical protein PR001_g852 [Phytophthora rubi]KAE9358779.1 hypothetical protein PR003_g1101 [Phytophthora rubi]